MSRDYLQFFMGQIQKRNISTVTFISGYKSEKNHLARNFSKYLYNIDCARGFNKHIINRLLIETAPLATDTRLSGQIPFNVFTHKTVFSEWSWWNNSLVETDSQKSSTLLFSMTILNRTAFLYELFLTTKGIIPCL